MFIRAVSQAYLHSSYAAQSGNNTLLLCYCVARWVALPEDAQEEAAAATGFQPTAADGLQPLEMYGERLGHNNSNSTTGPGALDLL